MKFRFFVFLLFLAVASQIGAGSESVIYANGSLLSQDPQFNETNSLCSSANTEPVSDCFDWVTGPQSLENDDLPMYWWDSVMYQWYPRTLAETDQGWPVMSPDGQQLELMVYGDTFVWNPEYTLLQLQADTASCVATYVPPTCLPQDVNCNALAALSPQEYCEYINSYNRRVETFLSFPSNAVFFDAEIDPLSVYHIRFHEHLKDKMIVRTPVETYDDANQIHHVGVYTLDYFYVCPGSKTSCSQADQLLHFLTSTVHWDTDNPVHTGSREGIGFYRFGRLADKYNADHGCRWRYGPPGAPVYFDPYVSCPGSVTNWIQPQDPHTVNGQVLSRTGNPHVYWGWGSKFHYAIVAHGFMDKYQSTSKRKKYIYFIGMGERKDWSVFPNMPTQKFYLARLPASEKALRNGAFEYYSGKNEKGSEWGSYTQAKPIIDFQVIAPIPAVASTFTARFGHYYMASTCAGKINNIDAMGMCVISSNDGFDWDTGAIDFAPYTVADPTLKSSPAKLVYGHAFVPEAIQSKPGAIAYLFSVWKTPAGYFNDFFFDPLFKFPIPQEQRFTFYNTKMYWYYPP